MRERDVPSTSSLPRLQRQPDLCQAEARSQELHVSLLHGWQEPKLFDPSSVVFPGTLTRNSIESKAAGTQTGTLIWVAGVASICPALGVTMA